MHAQIIPQGWDIGPAAGTTVFSADSVWSSSDDDDAKSTPSSKHNIQTSCIANGAKQ